MGGMPKSTECVIDIDLANALNQLVYNMKITISPRGRDLGFRCTECGRPVQPHQEGGKQPRRFEHRKRNPKCSLST